MPAKPRKLTFARDINNNGPGIIDLNDTPPTVFCYCSEEIANEILPFFKGKVSLKDTFEKRREEFGLSLKEFVDLYGIDLITSFFTYWGEPNRSRTKMRMELEKTWETRLRLQTWHRNNQKRVSFFGSQQQSAPQTVIGRQTAENINNNVQGWK